MKHARVDRWWPAVLALLLCACSAGTPDPEGGAAVADTASAADAAALEAKYEDARTQGNWPGAAALGAELQDKFPGTPAGANVARSLPEVQAKADALVDARRLEGLWTYQAIPAGKGTQRTASIDSRVPRAEEGELAQAADAQLILRDHPDWGRSAYLLIHEADFRCGSPCAMQIALDDAAATRWSGKQADSGKGPALFINDDARFISALEQARDVRITLPKGSGHLQSLRFEVAGFHRDRYDGAKPTPAPTP